MIIYPVRPVRTLLVAFVVLFFCGWAIAQCLRENMVSVAVVFGVILLFAGLVALASLRQIDRKVKAYFE